MKWLLIFFAVFSLQACATSKCYNVWVREPILSIKPYKSGYYTKVTFDGHEYFSPRSITPAPVICTSPPDYVEIEYYKDRQSKTLGKPPIKLPTLAVKSKIPDGFWQSPVRKIIFDVNEKGNGSVKFLMKLSEITTKEIEHTETKTEKQQRIIDEKLWLGISQNDEKKVENSK